MESLVLIIYHLPGFVLGLGIIGGVYWYFGKGLAFRIFGLMVPVLVTAGIIGNILGKYEFSTGGLIALSIPGAVISIGVLGYLYRVTVVSLSANILDLKSSNAQLSATATQSASTAAEQAGIVSEVSATIEEITQTSRTGAGSAQEIVEVTSKAVTQGQQGQSAVVEALSIMDRIGQVAAIVEIVNQLAEQSNLLAVNASIEAAKAGEHGRGFAVVASEVRSLAEQSRNATTEIRAALGLTTDGRRAIEITRDVIEKLMLVLEDASDRSRRIAATAMQQAAGIRQINEATRSLRQSSQDNAASSKQIEQAVKNMEGVSQRIIDFVGGKSRLRKR